MRPADWRELARYVRYVANECGLRDWEIILNREPAKASDGNGTVWAHICPTYGRKVAVLKIAAEFRTIGREQQRHVVVHELLHCHLDPIGEVIRCELYGTERLTKTEYNMLKSAHARACEFAVDGIAAELARRLPFVKWPKGERTSRSPKRRRRRR